MKGVSRFHGSVSGARARPGSVSKIRTRGATGDGSGYALHDIAARLCRPDGSSFPHPRRRSPGIVARPAGGLDGFVNRRANGHPLDAADFIAMVEMKLGRKVRPRKRGGEPHARGWIDMGYSYHVPVMPGSGA
jgi:hypothetical protein